MARAFTCLTIFSSKKYSGFRKESGVLDPNGVQITFREQSSSIIVQFADVMLGVELEAKLVYKVQLAFENVDALFTLMHQFLEKIAADVISHGMAMRCPFFAKSPHSKFEPEIAFEDVLHGPPDMEWMELHVGTPFQKDDPNHEVVGVLHRLDRFLTPIFRKGLVAPMIEQPVMQPILVHHGQLVTEPGFQIFDDFGLALHGRLRSSGDGKVFRPHVKTAKVSMAGEAALAKGWPRDHFLCSGPE